MRIRRRTPDALAGDLPPETWGRRAAAASGFGDAAASTAQAPARRTGMRPAVVLLHSSASSARQWDSLAEVLRPGYRVHEVEFHGHGMRAPWQADSPMRLADDVALATALFDEVGAAHVVGHSYGAAVALKLASMRSSRVLSLVAYEPVLFRWLRDDAGGEALLRDVLAVVQAIRERLAAGDARSAAQAFVDFWSGEGSWRSMPGPRQGAIATRMPAVLSHFEALFREPLARWQVASLGIPMLLLTGAQTVPVARRISELLRVTVPGARHAVLQGMGHMGPLTHAAAVNRWITGFLRAQEPPALAEVPGARGPLTAALP